MVVVRASVYVDENLRAGSGRLRRIHRPSNARAPLVSGLRQGFGASRRNLSQSRMSPTVLERIVKSDGWIARPTCPPN